MATKSQHSAEYRLLPEFLRLLREEAGLTQRDLGAKMSKPQSWIYNCETANRRVDITEFINWATSCGVDAVMAFSRFVEMGSSGSRK
jgi:transcriptional regulator with XRE-family HTH domain